MDGVGCGPAGMRGRTQNEEKELLQRDKWNSYFFKLSQEHFS